MSRLFPILRGSEFHPAPGAADVVLSPDELQMAITGRDVGFGMASSDVLIARLQSTENLLVRISERKLARPYRDHGRRDLSSGQSFISVPRAACLAVTFRVGSLQPPLPSMSRGEEIVDGFPNVPRSL